MTAAAVMAHATVNAMASVAATAMRKVAPQDVALTVVRAVAPAQKAIPKRVVKADAKVDVAAAVDVAAVVATVDAAKAKDQHKVKAKATESVLTLKASHRPRT